MNFEKTQAGQAMKAQLPPERYEERIAAIEQKNKLGKCFLWGSLPLFGLFAFLVVKTGAISVMAGFLLLVAMFVLFVGGNLYSNQYFQAAVEAALSTVKSLGGLRK